MSDVEPLKLMIELRRQILEHRVRLIGRLRSRRLSTMPCSAASLLFSLIGKFSGSWLLRLRYW